MGAVMGLPAAVGEEAVGKEAEEAVPAASEGGQVEGTGQAWAVTTEEGTTEEEGMTMPTDQFPALEDAEKSAKIRTVSAMLWDPDTGAMDQAMADGQPSQTRATLFESAHAAERDLEAVHAPNPAVGTPAKRPSTSRWRRRVDW